MTTTMTQEQRGDGTAAEDACPACGEKGRTVKRVTLESLLRPGWRDDIGDDPYYVCATLRCDTVYFSASHGQTFRKSDLTVRFGAKEADAPRHVCYCFDHTIEEIHDEIRRTGQSTVVDRIKDAMKGPGCRCAYTNPLGSCCLKTVQTAVASAFRSIGSKEQAAMVGAEYHIEGMTCEGCANILHGALLELAGVKVADVDFATRTAVVRYDPDAPVPPDRVIEAAKAIGFSATPGGS